MVGRYSVIRVRVGGLKIGSIRIGAESNCGGDGLGSWPVSRVNWGWEWR